MTSTAAAAPRRPFSKQDFYRICRLLHGWLSAIAFLVLCFFSLTGLLLNHPDWVGDSAPRPIEHEFTLEPEALQRLIDADEPERLLPELAAQHVELRGEMTGGNQAGNDLFVRMQGVRGLTDIRASLVTGSVEVVVERAPTVSILNELHRGERAGMGWRLLIDAMAVLLIALSIVGYLIFLSLRFRLRTALALTAASTIGIWLLFTALVA